MSVTRELESVLTEMRNGTYTESDGAVLITRDAKTGILTVSYYGDINGKNGREFLADAMATLGIRATVTQ
jgi:hypothetical protein